MQKLNNFYQDLTTYEMNRPPPWVCAGDFRCDRHIHAENKSFWLIQYKLITLRLNKSNDNKKFLKLWAQLGAAAVVLVLIQQQNRLAWQQLQYLFFQKILTKFWEDVQQTSQSKDLSTRNSLKSTATVNNDATMNDSTFLWIWKILSEKIGTRLLKMRSHSKQGIVNSGTNDDDVEEDCFPSRRATSAKCFFPARCWRQQSSPDV